MFNFKQLNSSSDRAIDKEKEKNQKKKKREIFKSPFWEEILSPLIVEAEPVKFSGELLFREEMEFKHSDIARCGCYYPRYTMTLHRSSRQGELRFGKLEIEVINFPKIQLTTPQNLTPKDVGMWRVHYVKDIGFSLSSGEVKLFYSFAEKKIIVATKGGSPVVLEEKQLEGVSKIALNRQVRIWRIELLR